MVNEIKEGMSVSEIQAVLKVSKKAIYDKLNKDEFEDLVVKVKGVTYIKPKRGCTTN